jgi:hypothetical protein
LGTAPEIQAAPGYNMGIFSLEAGKNKAPPSFGINRVENLSSFIRPRKIDLLCALSII